MTRPRPLRPPATGLPDHVVEAIVIAVIARVGQLDLDHVLAELRAARRRRRLHLVPTGPELATSCCPSGAA